MAKEVLEMEIKSNTGQVTKDVDKLGTATKKAQGGFRGIGTAIKGVGTAIKAAGIGLVVGLLAKLMDVFRENQKTLDFFNTSMTSLSIAFNDLFKFIEGNIGTVVGYFKSLFEDPGTKIRELATTIKEGLVDRFNEFVEVLGLAGKALGQLVTGEFSAAFDTIKEAGRESVDVLTGVDGSIEKIKETVKTAKDAIVDYTKSTIDQAKSITETNKAAEKAAVEFAKLNAQYLKDAEVQRQIRDDETKTFAQRIKANEDLNTVLEKQQKLQREQLAKQEKAAQLAFDINKSDANYIALQEAKVAVLELEETITGQLSEQKTNQVALDKELLEGQRATILEGMSDKEAEMEQLRQDYEEKKKLAIKSGMDTTDIDKKFAKQKADIARTQVNEQLEAFSGLAGALQGLAGESKALAIAQAVIDTYVGANKAFAMGGPVGFVTGAAVIAGGLANVKKIMEQDVGGNDGPGPGPDIQAEPPAPEMMSGRFELGGAIEPEPVQAYVVSDDVTNNQDKLAAIRRRATI
tara:strand:+ start:152 stop:1711 length:1560 start_codon:yes stop_codon:yes gene_type:complete